jgi:hypothetical protein
MDRRTLLLAALGTAGPGLSGCGLLPPPRLDLVTDAELVAVLDAAARRWPGLGAGEVATRSDASPRTAAQLMAALRGGLIATRDEKVANHLQRTGVARLQNRWVRKIHGQPAILLVTEGDWRATGRAKAFAKWLISPAAEAALR